MTQTHTQWVEVLPLPHEEDPHADTASIFRRACVFVIITAQPGLWTLAIALWAARIYQGIHS